MASKADQIDLEEEGLMVEGDFPWLKEIVPHRFILPGKEWAYVKVENFGKYKEDEWKMVPGVEPFAVDSHTYVVMSKGKGTLGSIEFLPEVSVDVTPVEAA